MIRTLVVQTLTIAIIAGCARDTGPAIVISDVRIFAPLTAESPGVAYLTMTNGGPHPVSVTGVRSPQFGNIEMHETRIDEDGVSRMERLSAVSVDPGSSLRFTEGGLHLMLLAPRTETRAGTPVTLEFELGDGLLIVNASLQNRLP